MRPGGMREAIESGGGPCGLARCVRLGPVGVSANFAEVISNIGDGGEEGLAHSAVQCTSD